MLPQRSRTYNGPITESKRWDSFEHRSDDIFVCTPPKCGTTWTQAICAMLVFGRANIDVPVGTISPWLDANTAPMESVNAMLEAQTHRRFIKTHTPLDGVPFFPECIYLAVYRDPRDTYFSMVNHLKNMKDERLKSSIPTELHSGFCEWARSPFVEGAAQQRTLAFLAHHFESFWRYRGLTNIHFFHYSDMKRDLAGAIQAIGEAIGKPVDKALACAMAKTASFENMRANARQFAPGADRGTWKADDAFFESGQAGRWRDILDQADLDTYRTEVAKLLPAEIIQWLEDCNPVLTSLDGPCDARVYLKFF